MTGASDMRIFGASVIPVFLGILIFLASAAQAAEIRVMAPGLVGPGLNTLIANWQAKTGNSVVIDKARTVGRIEDAIAAGGTADLVLLPSGELDGLAGKLKPGSRKKIGELPFGVAVLTGTPHPNITSVEKFRDAIKGKSVAYNDPAIGSLAGKMVDALLKQPIYASVKPVPAKTTAGQAVADGVAEMAVAMETEEVTVKGIDIVGPVPDGIGLKLDLSGAILANAPHPDEAAAFLAYFNSPEAAPILKPTGVVVP